MSDLRLGDIGTAIRLTLLDGATPVNISSATIKQIIFQKPDGTRVEKTATFLTNGSDGKLQYLTQAGDLDQTGTWKVQGYVAMPQWTGKTEIAKFKVVSNL